jgi:quercetin dioxygenase-like cupin family protein
MRPSFVINCIAAAALIGVCGSPAFADLETISVTKGVARLENASGQIEMRPIEPGDILSLPRGRKHGFRKSSDEDLVFLVVATPLPAGVEETTYDD